MSEEIQEYISDSKTISSSATLDLDLVKLLGAPANIGWITVDTGTAYLQINGINVNKITLLIGDTQNFEEEEKCKLKRIIVTGTAATIRYYFKRSVFIKLGTEQES